MTQTALQQAKELFPQERELRYKWGFDPKTKDLKLNIYYRDDDTFVIAFEFNREEENTLLLLLLDNSS